MSLFPVLGGDPDGTGLGADRNVRRARLARAPLPPFQAGVRGLADALEEVLAVVGADHHLGLGEEAGELLAGPSWGTAGVDAEEAAVRQGAVEVCGGEKAQHQDIAGVLAADGDRAAACEDVLELEGPAGFPGEPHVGRQQRADLERAGVVVVAEGPAGFVQEEVLQELTDVRRLVGRQGEHALVVPDVVGPAGVDVNDAGVDSGAPVPLRGSHQDDLIRAHLKRSCG
ncbi:hypothetical protein PXH67_40635 (plasmid) [Streptomyces sp. P8-A8]|uniref:hypothetical protein n=1 Tax=Streptomyces sp. P8-A8 TaxID=3029759 RepID=UPI0036DD0EDE